MKFNQNFKKYLYRQLKKKKIIYIRFPCNVKTYPITKLNEKFTYWHETPMLLHFHDIQVVKIHKRQDLNYYLLPYTEEVKTMCFESDDESDDESDEESDNE